MTKSLRQLTDDQLEKSADQARNQERDSIQNMINHLREIERRRLFSKRGKSSIYAYAMDRYGYTYHEANRRISAMRLMKSLPDSEAKKIETKLAEGALHLTHLTEAQAYFKKLERQTDTKVAVTEKVETLNKLVGATKNETKKILYNEDVKARYSFEADQALEETVEVLKGLNPHLSFDQLMKKICEMAREQMDPAAKAKRIREKEKKQVRAKELKLQEKASNGTDEITNAVSFSSDPLKADKPLSIRPGTKTNDSGFCASAKTPIANARTRYISQATKREVWLKAEGKCEKCKSTFALEFDHILPYAMGGLNTSGNVRLLCRSCNQRHAIESYGQTKMDSFISKPQLSSRN